LDYCTKLANARASAAARWLDRGKAWLEYKYQFDYKPILPALLPRILTNVAGNTPSNLSEGWAVGSKRLLGRIWVGKHNVDNLKTSKP
jgi:hypothetical protein